MQLALQVRMEDFAAVLAGDKTMLWTITVILFLLWLLGFIGFHILGAWIHLLLLVVIVMLILSLISGRRVL